MVIHSCAIIKGKIIIAIYSKGNDYEKEILRVMPTNLNKTEQVISGNNIYSFLNTPTLIFSCVSNLSSDKIEPLNFLDQISRRWAALIGPIPNNSLPHSYNTKFISEFSNFINTFGTITNKTSEINFNLNETEERLTTAITKALDREKALENINSKTEDLLLTSEEFKNQAVNLKWKMRCSYWKSIGTWTLIFLIIIYLILIWICGGWDLSPNCFNNEKK